MLSQWLDRGNNICDPFAKFAFYWLAFNGIYNQCSNARCERDRVCKSLVEVENYRVKGLLCKLKQGCLGDLWYLATRHPQIDGVNMSEEKGVLDLRTKNSCEKKVYSISRESLSYIESISIDPEESITIDPVQSKKLTEQIGDVLYTIRCNLFHGDKRPMEDDEDVVTHAIPILKAICETSEYR